MLHNVNENVKLSYLKTFQWETIIYLLGESQRAFWLKFQSLSSNVDKCISTHNVNVYQVSS